MSISSLLVVLSTCVSMVYTIAVPEPQITARAVLPRQTDQRFIGFYSTSGEITWDTARCQASSSWTVSGSYGRCCSEGVSCTFATRCSSDYAIVGGSSVSCPYTCNTDYVYGSTGGSLSTKWIGCAIGYTSTYFYETAPATAIFNTIFGTSTTDSTTDTPTGTVRPTVTVAPIVPTSTPTTSVFRTKKKSMIWIVGVVIGVVAIFAIAGIIAFILISRKKKKARAAALAAGTGNTYGGAPPPNFQPPMQQQYNQGPPMGAMGQPQYGPPPPEGGYYVNDPKNAQTYSQTPTSPPPPVWTPSQQHSPTQPPPVSPQTRHASLAASDVLSVDQQRTAGNKSPGGTVSEIGTNSINNLGSNPSLPPQSPTGTHLTNISEMNTPPTYPAQVAKVPMQAHNNQGPVSELQ
ncbi:hypothetical protein GLAREA_01373 [Glarea lozoyensis ATCC 20868]|uniref:Uncharacterized protein n=1 Tax=Glarea lozoyensis (strain ATCC 20868 / MF5171) TaxID=1116229 RepID=S3D071_GLAL2|nr:uncharacterized protein GLAREA_01373 [Glarea lozoyensis ATCC 20868]EPE25461.1 hypothetical protein GLAREA_01373 [Glarea lozoyensis ATCC 20868]